MRLVAAPIVYYTILNCSCIIAFTVFAFASLTDLVDGKVARKYNATSSFGAFLDVIVDYILVIISFLAFYKKQWYCIFVFIPITVSFINFLLSSGNNKPKYDPFGKYMGAVIMVMIGITLLFPYVIVREMLTYLLAALFIFNMISRTIYLESKNCIKDKGELT